MAGGYTGPGLGSRSPRVIMKGTTRPDISSISKLAKAGVRLGDIYVDTSTLGTTLVAIATPNGATSTTYAGMVPIWNQFTVTG